MVALVLVVTVDRVVVLVVRVPKITLGVVLVAGVVVMARLVEMVLIVDRWQPTQAAQAEIGSQQQELLEQVLWHLLPLIPAQQQVKLWLSMVSLLRVLPAIQVTSTDWFHNKLFRDPK